MIPGIPPVLSTIPEPAGQEGVVDEYPMQLKDYAAPFTPVGTLKVNYPWGPFGAFHGKDREPETIWAAIQLGQRFDSVDAARAAVRAEIADEQATAGIDRDCYAVIDAGNGAAIAARMAKGPGYEVSLGGTEDGSFVSRYLDRLADQSMDPGYYYAAPREQARKSTNLVVERTDPRLLEIWGKEYHVAFADGSNAAKPVHDA